MTKKIDTVDDVLTDVPKLESTIARVLYGVRESKSCDTGTELAENLDSIVQQITDALDQAKDLNQRASQIGRRPQSSNVHAPQDNSKKLTTREVTDSRLLMIMIARRDEGGPPVFGHTVERVAATVEAELKAAGRDLPVYDVRVSINGIELDFHDFAAEVQRQLDDMVMREAGVLLKQTVGEKLDDLIADTHQALGRLNEGIQVKAAEMLGYNPWRDE